MYRYVYLFTYDSRDKYYLYFGGCLHVSFKVLFTLVS